MSNLINNISFSILASSFVCGLSNLKEGHLDIYVVLYFVLDLEI